MMAVDVAPISPAFLSTAAYLASVAPGDQPDRCPHCGAHGPAPAFIRGCDAWMCADWRCARIFVAED